MKMQDGYLTKKSGAWIGHYSKWVTDFSTGQRTRQQRAFKIGPLTTTKTKAREILRERMVKELGITADSRATVSYFIEHRWKPQREGTWRESTKQTNGGKVKGQPRRRRRGICHAALMAYRAMQVSRLVPHQPRMA
jgi:hypothetical protein